MSAWPDDPDHFCRWLDEHAVTAPDGFAPRLAYGRYLQEQLVDADVRIETAEVVGLVPGDSTQVKLSDGRSLTADAVVLASGRPDGGMPESLERAFAPVLAAGTDGKVVLDPWAPGALAALGARRLENVLVIGSGLTGIDVALHLIARGTTVTLLSRNGTLPRRFRDTGAPAELLHLAALGSANTLEQVRAALGADLRAREAGLDWRQVIDAMRPRTTPLWRSLGWEDQRRFLREDLRQWEILRHRMPPTTAAAIDAVVGSGHLMIDKGEVADVSLRGSGVELVVTTSEGSVRRAVTLWWWQPAPHGIAGRCNAPRSGRTCWLRVSRRCTHAASVCGSTPTATSSTSPATRFRASCVSGRSARVRSGRPLRFPRSAPKPPPSRSYSPMTRATVRCGHAAPSRPLPK